MEDFINTFHVDWKLMIAQLINFGIVIGVLWKFALKPLMKTMDSRTKEIEKSLADAKRIEQEMKQLTITREEVLTEARKQSEEIQRQGEARSEVQRQETLQKVRTEAERVVQETRQKFIVEKEEMLNEVKKQASSLVVQAVAKVLGKVTTPTLDKKVIDEAMQEISNRNHKK
ncbi:MAG: F0F1 ATP synthase subunit B [Patescibacteria group bacterium]